jgi:serine phosphatase RsbU (regulator of sigma subunit)
LLLADVSGHGELAADTASQLRDLMRRNVNRIAHRRFVAAMNNRFTDMNSGGRFATAIVSSFFAPRSSLSLCNAGHPPPLIFRATDGTWTALDQSDSGRCDAKTEVKDLPLGIISDTAYTEYNTRLGEGDLVLCYTDAFSEAAGSDDRMLGVEGLLSVISAIQLTPTETFISRVIDSMRSLRPGNLEEDDATILLFRANGKRSSVRDNLLAPFRLLGPVDDESRIVSP